MSDLVERLRQRANIIYDMRTAALIIEAAAEIERLTQALASEREACALVAETHHDDDDRLDKQIRREIASAIRARGKEI